MKTRTRSILQRLQTGFVWLPAFWLGLALLAWVRPSQTLALVTMALAAAWLVGLLAGLARDCRGPADWPLAFIALWLPVNYWASADKPSSIAAAANVLAGIALFYLVLAVGRVARRPRWPLYGFLLVGAGLLLAVLLVPDGLRGRLPIPAALLALARRIPDTVNANVLAGALLPAAIMAAALTLAPGRWPVRVAGIALAAAATAVMMLGASRGALMGLAVGLLALFVALGGWHRLGGLAIAAAAAVIVWRVGPLTLLELLGKGGAAGSLAGRLEIWSRAFYALQDFVFTGIGIGTFHLVIPLLYPYFTVGFDTPIGHAHNLLLQIGVDLGLPGLIAYATILILSLWVVGWTAATSPDRQQRFVAAGLLGALVGVLAHGLFDAVLWGAKPAFVLWWLLGLASGIFLEER